MTGRVRAGAVVAATVAAVVVGGCSAPPGPSIAPPAGPYYTAPQPEGATVVPPTSPPPRPVDCHEPTASLRPFPDGERPTGPTVDAIRARGRLIVGIDTGSNLMSFRAPATGTVEGFDVDVAREIARDLLGSPDAVDFRILPYTEREHALSDGVVDIVAKTMSITCERREHIDFSSVYYIAHQRILTVDGYPIGGVGDLAGKRVCVGDGTTSLDRIRALQPAAVVVSAPMWADCLVMLQQRQVDAITTDDTLLAGLSTQDPYTRIVGGSLGDEPYGIGIAHHHDDLVRAVNGTLDRIRRDGTWEQLYQRWLTVLGPAPTPPAATYRN
ncbi:glutamate ABC transporter substrate-binding protein [Prescottella subtropica]|uniref:glutamate ABC transporter substrate-binding protein n=1 Tax=Prescottella subtropica TaxID=2545757 RepID=UPI001F4F369B|nr:glutamate ABC transporter substrate-binding protein [Prescottella subtropica]